ncbi:hypothetical protein, partial [Serratia sp. DD3]|uniref:hypothetical protein n=1 Tax=Serratia sp. DD3 TaxID=1410619 RepID=UPI001F4575A7
PWRVCLCAVAAFSAFNGVNHCELFSTGAFVNFVRICLSGTDLTLLVVGLTGEVRGVLGEFAYVP